MKKFLRILAITLPLLLISAAVVSTAAAAPNPFIGAWESIDTDGSYQTLTIGGGPGDTHFARYYDFGATVCGLDPDTNEILYAASAMGFLTETGNDIHGSVQVYCQTAPPEPLPYLSQLAFTYQAETDTLIDIWGVVWSRR